jgi:diguanylate cyclase (GGDEF)-like protein
MLARKFFSGYTDPGYYTVSKNKTVPIPTIGVLFDPAEGDYSRKIINGVIRTDRMPPINTVFFAGGQIDSAINYNRQDNIVYNFINSRKVDGLIILGSIANNLNDTQREEFLGRFGNIPKVVIAARWNGMPCVMTDNETGLHELIRHLVSDHHCRRIAFLKGPDHNYDADLRFSVYRRSLEEAGIPWDETLVGNGEFWGDPAYRAFGKIYQDTKGKLDAVVCANDDMALAVYRFAAERGLDIPGDFAVIGFDNTGESLMVVPALTTVAQPVDLLAEKALDALCDLMAGKPVADTIIIPSHPVYRESCGCKISVSPPGLSPALHEKTDLSAGPGEEDSWKVRFPDLFVLPGFGETYSKLAVCFRKDAAEGRFSGEFIKSLNDCLEQLTAGNATYNEIESFNNLIRKTFVTELLPGQLKQDLENIHLQIQGFFSHWINTKNQQRDFLDHQKTDLIDNLVFRLMESSKTEDLNNDLNHVFKQLGVDFYLLCLYRKECTFDKEDILFLPKEARIEAGMIDGRDVDSSFREFFPTARIMPEGLEPLTGRKNLLILSVSNQLEHYGYLVFSIHPGMIKTFFNLKYQIGSAIRRIKLLKEISNLDKLKNDFIANITHDFKSPLTVILNTVELGLHYRVPEDKEVVGNYQLIQDAGNRLRVSIEKLLELARMDARGVKLNVTELDLTDFLLNLYSYYKSYLSPLGIGIEKDFSENDHLTVFTDEEKLEEVLQNILSNAVKFVEKNSGLIRISLIEKEKSLIIRIDDNGLGIPEDKQESIFNRFEQAQDSIHAKYGGTGIGLAFARQLLGYLKGSVWAESPGSGKGSSFFVELKKGFGHFTAEEMGNASRNRIHPANRILSLPDGNDMNRKGDLLVLLKDPDDNEELDPLKARILIVDDEEPIRKVILNLLASFGYSNFIAASNGFDGLKAASLYHPDIIISDFNMPDLRGDEFHERLVDDRNRDPAPVIFLSAVKDKKTINLLREKGIKAYLNKPIDREDLQLTLAQVIREEFDRRKLSWKASRDLLTGLYNQSSIKQHLISVLEGRGKSPLTVIFCDIDFFKQINDTHGHQAGDLVLKRLGALFATLLRKNDIVGRYGGEEFLVILDNTTGDQAMAVVRKIQSELAALNREAESLPFTMSYGIASLPDNPGDMTAGMTAEIAAEWLTKQADCALYQAKETECESCGYSSADKAFHEAAVCPECGSGNLRKGRNRMVVSSHPEQPAS